MQRVSKHKVAGRREVTLAKASARSRVTNGKIIVPDTDGRSVWCRRMRDIISLHVRDAGGEDLLSEEQLSIIRRIATLTVVLERLEQRFANDDGTVVMLGEYQRCSNTLRRLLESIGLERQARDVTPTPVERATISVCVVRGGFARRA
jgi:hypothetical protein